LCRERKSKWESLKKKMYRCHGKKEISKCEIVSGQGNNETLNDGGQREPLPGISVEK
jgi:hypothetical protein